MSPLFGFPPAFLKAKGAGAMSHTWAMCARMNENRSFMCCTGRLPAGDAKLAQRQTRRSRFDGTLIH
jgi:hypothetical protein